MYFYRHRRAAVIVAAVIALAVLTGVVYDMAVSLVYRRPLSDPGVGFTYVEPRYLPAGYHIAGRRIETVRGSAGDQTHKLLSVTAFLGFAGSDSAYGIREQRAAGQQTLTALTDYDPASSAVTCISEQSPQHRTYRLCHWMSRDARSIFEVQWVQDGTFIHATFPAGAGQTLSVRGFGQFVDSCIPASPAGIRIMTKTV